MKKLWVGLAAVSFSFGMAWGGPAPLPVKKKFTVASAAPLEKLWGGLSAREKKLAYHLQRAARAGRDLLFFQSHRHALLIKDALEQALDPVNYEATQEYFGKNAEGEAQFQELLVYLAQFEDQGGPYGTSNRKYILQKVPPTVLKNLLRRFSKGARSEQVEEAVALMTDPEFEVIRRPETPTGLDLIQSGGNIYQMGLSGEEVRAAIHAGLKIDLNCQVVKNLETGVISCQKMTAALPGRIGQALSHVVRELIWALPYATSRHQFQEIEYLIRYFRHGEQEDFRQASIEWVRDGTDSKVDFIMGFIEVYDDYLGNVGTWESYVQIVDPETTRVSQQLARNAQYFEDKMPYGKWKKSFPGDYAPPALMVYYFQEIADMRSGGYNLPNFDDIRKDIGFKNIIRLPLPGDLENPERRATLEEMYRALGDPARVDDLLRHQLKQRQVLVLLHEIIGHGSGTYDPARYGEKEDPISALAASGGSALEEQRADLAALVFAGDPKLVEVGIYSSQEEALQVRDAMYDIYLIDFLRWIGRERTFAEAHLRGHWLLIKILLEQGAIEWRNPGHPEAKPTPDQQVLVVRDYDAFWKISYELLRELQDIKANRRATDLEKLFQVHAPLEEIQSEWAQAMIRRGENLKANAGSFEQGWVIDSGLNFLRLDEGTLEGLARSWSSINYQR